MDGLTEIGALFDGARGNALAAAGDAAAAEPFYRRVLSAGFNRNPLYAWGLLRTCLMRDLFDEAADVVQASPYLSEFQSFLTPAIRMLQRQPVSDADRADAFVAAVAATALDARAHFWAALLAPETAAAHEQFKTFMELRLPYPAWQWQVRSWELNTVSKLLSDEPDEPETPTRQPDDDNSPVIPPLSADDVDEAVDDDCRSALSTAAELAGQRQLTRIRTREILEAIVGVDEERARNLVGLSVQDMQSQLSASPRDEPGGRRYSDAVLWALSISRWSARLARRPSDTPGLNHLAKALLWAHGGIVAKAFLEPLLRSPSHFYMDVIMYRLNARQCAMFERLLANNDDDLYLRYVLIGFEAGRVARSRAAHALWLTPRHPRHHVTGSPHCSVDPTSSEVYAEIVRCWSQHVAAHPDDRHILANAAEALTLTEPLLARRLLERGSELFPDEACWFKELSHLAMLSGSPEDGQSPVANMEKAIQRTESPQSRFHLQTKLPGMCLHAGDLDAAVCHAHEVLRMAGQFDGHWNVGNAVNQAHSVLGRVALDQDDVETAKRELFLSIDAAASPQLGSFGPDMALAARLLERGHRDTVRGYLTQCRTFWESGRAQLDAWCEAIDEGKTPPLHL